MKDRPEDVNADSDGKLRKSRGVVRGDQMPSPSKESRYAPLVNPATTRLLLALGAARSWTIRQADVVVAYLYCRLSEPVYKWPPSSIARLRDQGCVVEGSLCGLPPAAQIWYKYISDILQKVDFRPSPYDTALWTHRERQNLYVTTHVDDFNIFSKRPEDGNWLIESLMKNVEGKDLQTPEKYLGMQVISTKDCFEINQSGYIESLFGEFNLFKSLPVSFQSLPVQTLMMSQLKTSSQIVAISKVLYVYNISANSTRPDISRAASCLQQYNVNPTQKCFEEMFRFIRYVGHTKYWVLVFLALPPAIKPC